MAKKVPTGRAARRDSVKPVADGGDAARKPSRQKPDEGAHPKKSKPSHAAFPVVGMGASAGGLEAFTAVLRTLPPDTGMAFVLIQHLDPHHESLLSDLLSKATSMPVEAVRDRVPVQPNHVYVIPPNVGVLIENSLLRLIERSQARGGPMPIDAFFRALATQLGRRAIGVVLSGTGSDGALGVEAIKSEGGITLTQDGESAKYSVMPRAAAATGCVDFVLPPEGIARELARIAKHPYLSKDEPAGEETEQAPDAVQQAMGRIFAILRAATLVDFSLYKQTTIRRRIGRRLAVHKLESIDEYVTFLKQHPAEVEALYREILINVTSFFRDPGMFDVLKGKVLPEIVGNLPGEAPIRVWAPGCATGEEVYSLAMAILEFTGERHLNIPIQIFGTDISDEALEKARAGLYLENISLDVSPERLRRFFVKQEGGYQVSKPVRDLCVFARQNVAKDPPFSKLDVISCRNVLIYLDAPLQKRIVPMFHYALKPHGFLLLGGSETIGGFTDMFEVADKAHRVFRKRHLAAARRFEFEPGVFVSTPWEAGARARQHDEAAAPDLQKEADRLVISHYGPPGVIINDEFEVLQFRGKTSPYLEPAPGKASLNLLKMLREGLLLEVRNAVQKVKRTGEAVRKKGVPTKQHQGFHDVDFEVMPLQPTAQGRHFLVLFRESEPAPAPAGERRGKAAADRQSEQVRQELLATRQYLQSIIEEQGATNEELQSANEEILSSNEELQSINEELETAKEELQSTNEELTTVNEELQNRNIELTQTNDDLNNLLASVNMAIVMLSSDLRIRRFTPIAARVLHLIPADVGRPITDLRPAIHVPDLGELIHDVLDSVNAKERDVVDSDGRWYSMAIRPYRTSDNRIDGVVLTLMDIEAIRRGFDPSRSYRDFVQVAIDLVQDPMAVVDLDFHVRYANPPFVQLFCKERTDGPGIFQLDPTLKPLIEPIARRGGSDGIVRDVELPDGSRKLSIHAQVFPAPGGREMLVMRLQPL